MKMLPVLLHAIIFILRSGRKSKLTYDDLQRSISSNYRNINVIVGNNKHGYEVINMHLCYNEILFIFHRVLVIINRFLPFTSEDAERPKNRKILIFDV